MSGGRRWNRFSNQDYRSLEEREAASRAYWKERNECDFQRRCVKCERSLVNTNAMSLVELTNYRLYKQCIFCQYALDDADLAALVAAAPWVHPLVIVHPLHAVKPRQIGPAVAPRPRPLSIKEQRAQRAKRARQDARATAKATRSAEVAAEKEAARRKKNAKKKKDDVSDDEEEEEAEADADAAATHEWSGGSDGEEEEEEAAYEEDEEEDDDGVNSDDEDKRRKALAEEDDAV